MAEVTVFSALSTTAFLCIDGIVCDVKEKFRKHHSRFHAMQVVALLSWSLFLLKLSSLPARVFASSDATLRATMETKERFLMMMMTKKKKTRNSKSSIKENIFYMASKSSSPKKKMASKKMMRGRNASKKMRVAPTMVPTESPSEQPGLLPPFDPEKLFAELRETPDVRDRAVALASYPNLIHEQLFGSQTSFYPVYQVDQYNPGEQNPGDTYTISLDNGDSTVMTVLEIIYQSSDFDGAALSEPVDDTVFQEELLEMMIFFGKIGSPVVEIVGVVLHVPNIGWEEQEPVTTLVIFREALPYGYSDFGYGSIFSSMPPRSASSSRSLALAEVELTSGQENKERRNQEEESSFIVSACRSFLQDALEANPCPDLGEQTRLNNECAVKALSSVQPQLFDNLIQYNEAVEVAEKIREEKIIELARSIHSNVASRTLNTFKITYCRGDCSPPGSPNTLRFPVTRQSFSDFTIDWAERFLRRELTVKEATRRQEIDDEYSSAVAAAKENREKFDSENCPFLIEAASMCFECFFCSTSDPLIECCVDDDCAGGTLCVSNICITSGSPRFSLTWFGDDDLDIHVITPAGNEIDFSNARADGGFLDYDDIPSTPELNVENIVFIPGEGDSGSYVVFVVPYSVVGLPDSWELEIFFGSELVTTHSGVATSISDSFTIEYLSADTPDGDCPVDELKQFGNCINVEETQELSWFDAIVDFEDLQGGTSRVQRVVYVDVDLIPRTKSYDDDAYWWKYYRSFWNEDGTKFVGDGDAYQQGINGEDCVGIEWYEKDTVEVQFEGGDHYSTRYCTPVSKKNSNDYCSVYLAHHYRARIGRYIPGLFTLGPTYDDPTASLPGVAMNFGIFLDEFVETSEESFSCHRSGFWKHVIPGEVTPEGWGVVPQIDEPQGTSSTPFFQWIFVVPKGKSLRIGKCLPTAVNCTLSADNVGDALLLDPPLSQISDEEREKREREKFERLIQEGASLGSVVNSRMRSFDKRKEGFYIQVKQPDGTWTSSEFPITNTIQAYDLIKEFCNCLTINGSGNRFEAGLKSGTLMADEAGREVNVHYYMPVSAGPDAYVISDANSLLPQVIGQFADRANHEDIRLDMQGHSWSSWLLWKGCSGKYSGSRCQNIDLVTWAPATMPYNWEALRRHIDGFRGEADVVFGSKDPWALPTLSKPLLCGELDNPNIDPTILDTGHGLQGLTDECVNCL